MTEPNGKVTAQLTTGIVTAIVATIGLISAVATPIILMFSKLNSLEVSTAKSFMEVETQFRAADEFRNVNLANQQRINSLLWQQAFGATFPEQTYYPTISK